MIDKSHGFYVGFCDVCFINTKACETYKDLIDEMKSNGWKAKKVEDEWENICSDCAEVD
jgi:hypothetical protein